MQRIRSSVVCIHAGELLCVRLQDPFSEQVELYPPGGAIEPGESPAQTAIRETKEETGYDVVTVGTPLIETYPFTWGGKTYQCTTHYFRAKLISPKTPQPQIKDEPKYHLGVEWIPIADIDRAFHYDTGIREAIKTHLSG